MSNEGEERKRQRIVDLAHEDLRKEVPALLADIRLAATKGLGPEGAPTTMTMYRHAALLAVLSNKADIQTRRIVKLTRALVWLSVVLVVLTAVLAFDVYLRHQENKRRTGTRTHDWVGSSLG
jgi:hypothetical protein